MANPFKAEYEAEIGGNARILRLGANELVELQTFLGRGPLALIQPREMDFREAVAVIHFGLRGMGVRQDFAKTMKMVDGMPVTTVVDIGGRALLTAMGLLGPDEGGEGNAGAPGATNGLMKSPGAV